MRSINNLPAISADVKPVAAIPSVSSQADSGIHNNYTVEIRGTLTKVKKANQDRFAFYNGKVAARYDGSGYFGIAIPFPSSINEEGGRVYGDPMWIKHVSKPAEKEADPNLTLLAGMLATASAEQKAQLMQTPQFAGLLDLLNPQLQYTDFCLETVLAKLGITHKQVKLSFTVPQKFNMVIDEIIELMKNKDKGTNYSFVIRFDLSQMNLAIAPKEQYESEGELYKQISIVPTYIGYVEGVTQTQTVRHADPELVGAGLQAGIKVAEKKPKYVSISDMRAESKAIAASIGTGKKGHHTVKNQIFAAIEAGDEDLLQVLVEALKSVEGTNPHVPVGYTDDLVQTAKRKKEQGTIQVKPNKPTKKEKQVEETKASPAEAGTALDLDELDAILNGD